MNDIRYACNKLKAENYGGFGSYTIYTCPIHRNTEDYIDCNHCKRSVPHWQEGGTCSKCGYDITYDLDWGECAPRRCPNCKTEMENGG